MNSERKGRPGPDNQAIYDSKWGIWSDMKVYGPASRWQRWLIRAVLRETIKEGCGGESPANLIDFGCGEGSLTGFLHELLPDCRILGIDPSTTGIEVAKTSPYYDNDRLRFEQHPAGKLPGSRFAWATSFEVFEHIHDWQNAMRALAERIDRVLLFSFPTGRMRDFEVNMGHFRNFKRGEVEAFLKNLGWDPCIIWYAGFPFYSPLYREVCNAANIGNTAFTTGKFGWRQLMVSGVLYRLFRYGSTRRRFGDQFIGSFVRTGSANAG